MHVGIAQLQLREREREERDGIKDVDNIRTSLKLDLEFFMKQIGIRLRTRKIMHLGKQQNEYFKLVAVACTMKKMIPLIILYKTDQIKEPTVVMENQS